MGNYSRDTFELNKRKQYVGVRLQQGVPLVDADWNEMDDIRKHEIRSFLRNYVGDGVPAGDENFKIVPAGSPGNDFTIGGGTQDAPGRCMADGWEALIYASVNYTAQALYDNADLAAQWGVDPVSPLTTPQTVDRADLVYLDTWEREVSYEEDGQLVNPAIGVETCVRLRREWTVRVAEGAAELPTAPAGHVFYGLAQLNRTAGTADISAAQILDTRTALSTFSDLQTLITGGSSKAGDLNVTGSLGVGTPSPAWDLEVDGTIVGETVLTRTVRASRVSINGVDAQTQIDALTSALAALEARVNQLEGN